MTSLQTALLDRKLVRVQEKGQVTLPVEVRKNLGLRKGDLVLVIETEEGILISPQEIVATKALNRIGKVLMEKGLSLEEMIESGRKERGSIIENLYGRRPDKRK